MNPIKRFFSFRSMHDKNFYKKDKYLKVTDYSQWLLIRLLIIFFVFYIALIPTIKYFMKIFEGREITYGQSAVFIMQTLTTTGYGELLPFHSLPMILISLLLMVLGVIMIFIIAGSLMATLIEKSITPKAPTLTNLTGHIVFTAYHNNISHTIAYLRDRHIPYVVAAAEQAEAVELIDEGINCICADPAKREGIMQLGIDKARLVVASSDDTLNISIILGISTATDTPVLAVMENQTRARLAYDAGANSVVVLEETLGRQLVDWICADAIPSEFLNLIEVEVSPDVLKSLKPSIIHVGNDPEYRNKTLGDVMLRTVTGASVVAVWHDDGTVSKPTADTRIDETTLIVVGPHDNVDQLAAFMGGPGPGERVILVGAGRVGQKAGKQLNRAYIKPVVIDIRKKYLRFDGEFIMGDSTYYEVLNKAKIKEADTLIITLNDDNLNVFTALAARHLNPDINIVSRAVSADTIDHLHQAGARHVLSESVFCFQLLQEKMVELGFLPKTSDLVMREITWNNDDITVQMLAVKTQNKINIICLVKNNEVIKPTGDAVISKNDRLVVLGTKQDMYKVI